MLVHRCTKPLKGLGYRMTDLPSWCAYDYRHKSVDDQKQFIRNNQGEFFSVSLRLAASWRTITYLYYFSPLRSTECLSIKSPH